LGAAFLHGHFLQFQSDFFKLPPKKHSAIKRIPPWLTGLVERTFFVILIANSTNLDGIPEAMIGWLAIKLAINWQKLDPKMNKEAQTRGLLALSALISNPFSRAE